jgi:probable HAF family extracellular repeat protein
LFLSPTGVSGVGEVVVGASEPGISFFPGDSEVAFTWTKAGGAVGLGFLPGGIGSEALGVSRDGKTVAGTSYSSEGEGDLGAVGEAFIWTEAGGMVGLGVVDPDVEGSSEAAAISDDGTTVVGSGTITGPFGPSHAFRWTAAEGIVDLGSPGSNDSEAGGVSADGDVVAGSGGVSQAFRWTRATGMVAVPILAGDDVCTFATVSGNGRVVVGDSENSTSGLIRSFRWTKADGATDIGTLVSGQRTTALAVSRDGAVIVGLSNFEAFRWTPAKGIQSIQALLVANKKLAKVLAGWTLTEAVGVSPNGRKIVGLGIDPSGNQQGWVAEISDD